MVVCSGSATGAAGNVKTRGTSHASYYDKTAVDFRVGYVTATVSGVEMGATSSCVCCHTAQQSRQHVVMTATRYQSSCVPSYVVPS